MNNMDAPKTLGLRAERLRRLELLSQDHIAPLTAFVERIREAEGLDDEVPYFDPLDGGVNARCLCILEAPGAKAVASGFISRNNPDETAKNSFLLYQEAGIPRSETVLWNIVPWYIGDGSRTREADGNDIREGLEYLRKLIQLLPRLQAVVLVGQKAQKVERDIRRANPRLRILRSPHPSPLFVNNKPENRGIILDVLQELAAHLQLQPPKVPSSALAG
jgi:uracil-DNA glycosylase